MDPFRKAKDGRSVIEFSEKNIGKLTRRPNPNKLTTDKADAICSELAFMIFPLAAIAALPQILFPKAISIDSLADNFNALPVAYVKANPAATVKGIIRYK